LSIGFNYFVSTGNEADVSFAEILNYLAGREEVSIVAGYMEGLQGDGRLFIEACKKALQNKKLVTMLKVGRTASGAAAAASHTGALVGSDQVYDGMFKQFGVPRADDVEQMNALIALYTAGRLPKGKKMAIITISGGGGVVVADKCPHYGIDVVPLTSATQKKLRAILPPFGAVANPVDLTSQLFFDTELFQSALNLVMQDPEVDIGGFFYNLEMPDPDADKKIVEVYRLTDKPLVVFTWPTGQDYAVEAKRKIVQAGVPVIEHIPSGLWAISALADWVVKVDEKRVYPKFQPGTEKDQSISLLSSLTSAHGVTLTESFSKKILQAYDIPVTREETVFGAGEALIKAKKIGYPVVMKILSPDLPHKSDAGGVILNLDSDDAVQKAYDDIIANARKYKANARIEGVLVQEMLPAGIEVIVGVKSDPVFGPAVVLGLGGIFVEVLKDFSTRVAPLREEDAREMIDELKGSSIFKGVRGAQPADLDALISVILKVSRLAVELEDKIAELDINPLIVYEKGKGVVAADALVVLKG
jgi:acetate---CoA ligase (ADP-forming)